MSLRFTTDSRLGGALFEWWKALDEDRVSRAILRRAPSVTAVALTPPYQRLYRRLCRSGWPRDSAPQLRDRLSAAVGLLAHVNVNDQCAFAESMSTKRDEADRPPVSEMRFRRLLESPDLDALFSGIRRVLPLMERRVNVLALANDVIQWGDSVRKRWAYDYVWPDK